MKRLVLQYRYANFSPILLLSKEMSILSREIPILSSDIILSMISREASIMSWEVSILSKEILSREQSLPTSLLSLKKNKEKCHRKTLLFCSIARCSESHSLQLTMYNGMAFVNTKCTCLSDASNLRALLYIQIKS